MAARRSIGKGIATAASGDWRRQLPAWQRVRDALEGEDRVKARGELYVPKPRGMKSIDYANYLARAAWYGVLERTLSGLTGLVFRVAPTFTVPEAAGSLVEELTPEGFSAEAALREAVAEVLSLGRYGLLPDLPPVLTSNPVPTIATYRAEDIFRWEERTERTEAGVRRRVVRILLREEPETADDATRTLIRELLINDAGFYVQNEYQRTDEEVDDARDLILDETILAGNFRYVKTIMPVMAGAPLTEIPFIFVNPMDHRPRTAKPPMADLASVNLTHFRNSADYENALYLTSSPTPYIFGVEKEDVPKSIGPGNIWSASSREVRAGMIEFEGKGVAAQRVAMRDKEDQMAALGARLIADVRRENVTAETTRLQSRAETSILVAVVQSVTSAFDKAVKFAVTWAARDASAVVVKLNQDFIETRLSALDLRELVASWQSGAFSRQTLHENLQRGEIVPPNRTLEEEADLIDDELSALGLRVGKDLDEEVVAALEAALAGRLAGNSVLAAAMATIAAKAAAPPPPAPILAPPGTSPGAKPPGAKPPGAAV